MATVVITGANRGIGLEFARQFSNRGDEVIALVRQTSSELDALDVRVETEVDMTGPRLDSLSERLAGVCVDTLVLNAGVLLWDNLEHLNLDQVRTQFEVNTLGPLRTVRALRGLLKTGSKVVLMTSRMGSIGDNTSGGMYGYRLSKAALNAVGKSLSLDLKAAGIAVAILHPGFVRTGMTRGNGDVDPSESTSGLIARIDGLNLENTGTFWHAKGQTLPW